MLDPKFEKEVQQKMEGLEFSPSDEVWANLQRELLKEKRRRAPLLWLFFLLGGMLLGAGGASLFFFYGSSSHHPVAETHYSAATHTAAVPANSDATNASAAIHTAAATDNPGMSGRHAAINSPGETNGSGETHGSAKTPGSRGINSFAGKNVSGAGIANKEERVGVSAVPETTDKDPLGDPAAGLDKIRLSAVSKTARIVSSVVYSDKPAALDKSAASKARLTRQPAWEAGFTGGAGISSVSMAQVAPLPASPLPAFSQTVSLAARNPAGRISAQPSQVKPDLSYWAGIFVQRPLFKKLTLAVGLNLHYYSTRLEIGQKVVDNPNTTASLFYLSTYTQPAALPYPSYSTGNNDEYTNRYYFLEVPVSLQWRFNGSRKIPLFWEGGLSFSRLMSADALYFDEKTRVYYKDGQVANPTQFMAFSSLMAGLSWRGNLIQVGPEGQYGLGSLLNTNSSGSQHLFYGGIRVTVIPRKW